MSRHLVAMTGDGTSDANTLAQAKLLGTYVGVFALVSVLVGRLFFGDHVPATTWVGLAIVVAGSLVIQSGARS